MNLLPLAEAVHASPVAEWMRNSLKAMPFIEAIHVLAVAVVFGSILIVDLRLLGFPSVKRAYTLVSGELLRLTWLGFAAAAVTGALMFAPNAITYYNNTAFRLKMLALLAAGINMLIFQFVTERRVAAWDKDRAAPAAAKLAGLLSILLWIAVIALGRWIGFSKGYDFAIPQDVQFEF
ncbi:MAG: hypothetical protein RL030_1177 [Pseudomonadota bacterium]|jgi:hypothetical protein